MLVAMAASACVLVLAGATMAELAESGRTQGPWGVLDDTIAASLRAEADTAVLQVFAALTHLGDTWVLTALALAVAAALWWRQHRLLAMGWLVALAGNGALTKVLKNLFERVRPEHTHGIAEASGYSFPSGHSSASMVAYAMLAYLATRLLAPCMAPACGDAGRRADLHHRLEPRGAAGALRQRRAGRVAAGWNLGGVHGADHGECVALAQSIPRHAAVR